MAHRPVTEDLPRFIEPMLASTGPLPAGEDYALEVKWDGCRAQLRLDRGAWTLRSRPGRDCSASFPELGALADALAHHRVLLDGELVCFDADGYPDFAAIRARMAGRPADRPGHRRVVLVAFDVLHLDGHPTRQLPYRQRSEILQELLPDTGPAWRVPQPLAGPVSDVLAVVGAHELEGIVAKRLDAPYAPGRRSRDWLKHKLRRSETLTITGWLPARNGQPDACYVARPTADGGLAYAGTVSLGLGTDERATLRAALTAAQTGRPGRRGVVAVQPVIRVVVAAHGRRGTPLRDPVIRAVLLDDAPALAA